MTEGLAAMPDDIRLPAINYVPQVLNRRQWAEWGDQILEAMAASKPPHVHKARKMLSFISAFVGSLDRWGYLPPLDPLFTPENVERHLITLRTEASRRTARGMLHDVGWAVNPSAGWPPARQKLSRSPRPAPYTTAEIRSLLRAANQQPTVGRAKLFQVTLALGLGAGLDGRTVRHVQPHNIDRRGTTVAMTGVEDRPDVPIAGQLGHWLEYWAERTKPGAALATKSQLNTRMTELVAVGGTKMSLARARSTFVAHLIENDVPLRQLLALSGLTSASALSEYIVHCAPVDVDAFALLDGYDPLSEV